MKKALISDIKRFAIHDGNGIRTTVFFKGCPLKCVWCHNPECISFQKETAFYQSKCIGCGTCRQADFRPENCLGEAMVTYGKEMTVDELLPILLEDRDFYETSGGGVTLSGGECLCQSDFCAALLMELKKADIHTAVDTCGYVPQAAIEQVLPYADIFLYDIKAIDPAVHIACTGYSNELILKNLAYIDSAGKEIEIRVPYVPGFNHMEMEKIAAFLKPLKNIQAVKVLPYHNYAAAKYRALKMEDTLPKQLPSEEEIQAAEAILKRG